MATQFDGVNRVITLNAGGAVHTVDAKVDLYSDWKEWVQLSDNSRFPPAFRTTGGDPLTPGITAGAYFFLRNDIGWRIRPAEEDSTITLVGNLAPEDSSLPILIPTIGNFSVLVAGLQPITQSVEDILTSSQSADFRGAVTIDTIDGTSGTAYPAGTARQPVNNLADAITIANREGFTAFNLKGTITLTQNFDGYIFTGISAEDNDSVALNGQSVDRAKFTGVTLSGGGSGQIELIEGQIDNLSGVYGLFRRCGLNNNFTLGLGDTTFHNCFSNVAGNTKPWVDLNGFASTFGNRSWAGGFEMRGVSNIGAVVSIDMEVGRVLLAASCSAGEIVVGGNCEFIDQSTGSNVIVGSLVEAVDVKRTAKAVAYRQYTNSVAGTLDIYDDDDNLIAQVPIFEDDGVTPWDGAGPIVRRDKIT